MESPRKFNDCYFYYYSTCTKGDNCVFRHEPSALGCETMCTAWQQGKCLDKRCKLRHMELRKNRKQIPCYWETQPGGCRKKHCPFMHKNPDARTDGIAPSQPAPQQPVSASACAGAGAGAGAGAEGPEAALGAALGAPPAPVPMLWQHPPHQHQHQQRQVVLDSAILGVLPGGGELLSRRVGGVGGVGGHQLEAPNPYAPLPVDPLVVNFEEESDNESVPSSTPTKPDEEPRGAAPPAAAPPHDEPRGARHELLLLERIQAEAAAFYSYDPLPLPLPHPPEHKDRKIVRTNLSIKYDRLSLDELAGKKHIPPPVERRKSLDFKVLSLEEIRARKKVETIIQPTPITLNLSRKRKLSTQETVTSEGNKIIKVVRSNSIVYKKLDPNTPAIAAESSKVSQKRTETVESRKRTLSELSDAYEIQADELVDNCYEFKRIKVTEHTSKPRLIRHWNVSGKSNTEKENNTNKTDTSNNEDDSESEVQIVSVDIANTNVDISDCDIIDVTSGRMGEPVDVVDLSDDDDEVTITGSEMANVPDVVASCHKKVDSSEKDYFMNINSVLSDDTLKNIDSILNEDSNLTEDEL